jgi:putative transposase
MNSKTTYNPNIHHRQSIRLKGYDYAQSGLYFITINCQNRLHLFGEVIEGDMYLNNLGLIARNEWINTAKVRKNCAVHDFIIMPDHLHGIIEIQYKIHTDMNLEEDVGKFQSPSHAVGSIVRGFKISVIKKIKEHLLHRECPPSSVELQFDTTGVHVYRQIKELNYKIWQRNYYEHIIRNASSYHRIRRYILRNPKRW